MLIFDLNTCWLDTKMPWVDTILEQFEITNQYSTNITKFFGPYNTLLVDLFPHIEGFQVVPDFKAPITSSSIDQTCHLI